MFIIKLLGSTVGRWIRVGLGLTLLAMGLSSLLAGENQKRGLFISPLGLVMLSAGSFDFCLLGPLVGLPLNGKEARVKMRIE